MGGPRTPRNATEGIPAAIQRGSKLKNNVIEGDIDVLP